MLDSRLTNALCVFLATVRFSSSQITTLVNHKERPIKSERMLRALVRVGLAVQMAVDRFVSVGETIAEENREIEESMCEASKEARIAGESLVRCYGNWLF